jgi:hypothetical protein
MRLVQGLVGGGRLKTGEFLSFVKRRTQQLLPCFSALERKCAARPGFASLIEK